MAAPSGLKCFIVLLVLIVCTSFLCQTDALYIPSHRVSALKRSAEALQSREKRYTDYQERASAFCTGLCMYTEHKSYSACFDVCNWY